MGVKRCFKCGQTKPLDDFYAHPRMKDGTLNKCKECAKEDVARRIERVKQDPEWCKRERERGRNKMATARACGRAKPSPRRKEYLKAYKARRPEACRAWASAYRAASSGGISRKSACEWCSASGCRLEMHHEDYGKPLEVVWLCCKCHGLTRRIDYDPRTNRISR